MTDKTNYENALDEIETSAELEDMGKGEAALHRENRANALATLALADAVKEQTEAAELRNNALSEIKEAKKLLCEVKKEVLEDEYEDYVTIRYKGGPLEKLMDLWHV